MILYNVSDTDCINQFFSSRRAAVRRAREVLASRQKEGIYASVYVSKLTLPKPSAALVLGILNESGYVQQHEDILILCTEGC